MNRRGKGREEEESSEEDGMAGLGATLWLMKTNKYIDKR
jgi:hypothetical protein